MIGMGKPITRTPKMAQKHPRTLPKPVIGDTFPYPTWNINYPVLFLLMKISFQIVDKSVESMEKFVSNLDDKSDNINIVFRRDSINS